MIKCISKLKNEFEIFEYSKYINFKMCHIWAISFFIHHTGPRWNQFLQFIQRLDHLLGQLTETEDSVVEQAIVGKDWAAQRLGY